MGSECVNPLAILAEPRRQQIMQAVWHCEMAASEIHRAVGSVTFGAVSQHLKVLREAGLVMVRKKGRQRFYRADHDALGALKQYFEEMWGSQLERLKALAEAEDKNAEDEN